jgi:pyruvate dehydrogenase (quinone)
VPPTPPHINVKFAAAYAKSILKGDPESLAMIRQTLRDTIGSWLPRRNPAKA